jgi:hypothetical protein
MIKFIGAALTLITSMLLGIFLAAGDLSILLPMLTYH